jgi:hypothetical protein
MHLTAGNEYFNEWPEYGRFNGGLAGTKYFLFHFTAKPSRAASRHVFISFKIGDEIAGEYASTKHPGMKLYTTPAIAAEEGFTAATRTV